MAKACTEDGCDRKHKARGLCATHYHGAARKAAPTVPVSCLKCGETFQVPATGYRRSTCPSCNRGRNGAHHYGVQIAEDGTVCGDPKLALSALRSDATVTDSGCWEWPTEKYKPARLMRVTVSGVRLSPIRLAWWAVTNELPDAPDIVPTCGASSCINPAHLKKGGGRRRSRYAFSASAPMPERLAEVKAYATVTDSGCWEWPKLDRKGYPRNITLATVGEPAHRAVLTAVLGRPLGAEAAHHTCANRACVNPDHLQPVTAAENTAEMLERRAYRARIAELEKQLAALAS